MSDNSYSDAWVILLTEYLFIILPFIVIAIVKIYSSDLHGFLKAPDWSFASSILFGQLLVKMVSGSLIRQKVKWQRVSFIIAIILVCGLIPSLTTLTLILVSNGGSAFAVNTQIVLFILSSISFFGVGSAAQSMMSSHKH
ncbi:hypothetical protein [Rheinheimera nanhaiensis]|uniref:hypothetical protein n=1 Tax=Rheinheimera nanhaiensis TaxID=1163621 RepID=UPI00058FCA96|nr:hypothetical protein [Rheinheimera nanhaiensis]